MITKSKTDGYIDEMYVKELEAENERLKEASWNLINKLNEIQDDPHYCRVFQLAAIHDMPYFGKNYSKEYDELYKLLSKRDNRC